MFLSSADYSVLDFSFIIAPSTTTLPRPWWRMAVGPFSCREAMMETRFVPLVNRRQLLLGPGKFCDYDQKDMIDSQAGSLTAALTAAV